MAGVVAALAIVRRDRTLAARLWSNVRHVRAGLAAMGYQIGQNESPIVPIYIGAADRTIAFWRALLDAGLYVNIVLPPGCKPDACLLRTSYSAAHTTAQLDRALATFESIGRKLSIIETAA